MEVLLNIGDEVGGEQVENGGTGLDRGGEHSQRLVKGGDGDGAGRGGGDGGKEGVVVAIMEGAELEASCCEKDRSGLRALSFTTTTRSEANLDKMPESLMEPLFFFFFLDVSCFSVVAMAFMAGLHS